MVPEKPDTSNCHVFECAVIVQRNVSRVLYIRNTENK